MTTEAGMLKDEALRRIVHTIVELFEAGLRD